MVLSDVAFLIILLGMKLKPCFTVETKSFFKSSKQRLKCSASFFDMPSLISCFSKALLVARTRHPNVKYSQDMSSDMRII